MNKRALMLSAATAVILSSQAFAAAPVDSVATTAQKTSTLTTPLAIGTAGGIKLTSGTAPLLTIDSGTSATPFVITNTGGTLTFSGVTSAVGVFVDGTAPRFGSFDNNGTIDLTGTGTSKIALHLSGATGSYTGPITFDTASVVNIAGDSSTGVLQDAGFVLNGDLNLAGSFTMSPTTANGTASSSIVLANLSGTINGNVTVGTGATYNAVGNGADGINITGPIQACNATATPACTEIGTFSNSGTISVAGVATRSSTVTNAESGAAVIIGNSIAGGFLNNGPSTSNAIVDAVISANGVAAPTFVIAPSAAATTGVQLGLVSTDKDNGTFGFINRGSITASPENNNANTTDVSIAGTSSTTQVTIAGGIFNSGAMTAQSTSVSPGNAVSAVALQIGQYVTTPLIEVSGESSTTTGNGRIAASISGTQGGSATAILISGSPVNNAPVTSVKEIDVTDSGSISAVALVTDPTNTAVTVLQAVAIKDLSNSLATIKISNGGSISAQATTLTNGLASITHAIDVSSNTIGLELDNGGAITGDVLFGTAATGTNAYTLAGTSSSQLATQTGAVTYGGGISTLTLSNYSSVSGAITSQGATLTVLVGPNSTLSVQNVVVADNGSDNHTNLEVKDFSTTGGNLSVLNLSVTSGLASKALIQASNTITISSGTNLNVTYGGFIPQGGTFILLSTPHGAGNLSIDPNDVVRYNNQVGGAGSIPFLFQSASISLVDNFTPGTDDLVLSVLPKTEAQLGLTGYAVQMFPVANAALPTDSALGAAMVAGINSSQQAEAAYSAFAPDVSGGTRAVAVSLTDQSTGIVAARERQLRLFAKEPGELTLWGNEFGEYLSTHGQNTTGVPGLTVPTGSCTSACPSVSLPGFKDHGFGFSLGLDSGSPSDGWYGAAFSFYTGDVQAGAATVAPTSKTGELWYLLTGYSDWRGRGLFVDSQVSLGYGDLKGKRFLDLTLPVPGSSTEATSFSREADSKRAALLGSLGLTVGALLKYGDTFVTPQISLDGMSMREEGYSEINGGTGFDLAVKPYYANSLRTFLGTEVRQDIDVGDFFLQPSARVGYRFDFLNDPTKLHAQFSDSNTATLGLTPGTPFTVQGPDPSRGNLVGGLNLNATTDNWTIGLSYDFVRGSNNATEQTGTISLLGRI